MARSQWSWAAAILLTAFPLAASAAQGAASASVDATEDAVADAGVLPGTSGGSATAPAAAAAAPLAEGRGAAPGSDERAEPHRFPGAAGVPDPVHRGTWLETSAGVLSALGGGHPLSTPQPYLGLALGRDFTDLWAGSLNFGVGQGDGSCFARASGGNCSGSDAFGLTFFEAGISRAIPLSDHLRASIKGVGGMSSLSPSPLPRADGSVPGSLMGPHLGAGGGLEYDAPMDHFTVGIDGLLRSTLTQRPSGGAFGLWSIAVVPRLRYVF